MKNVMLYFLSGCLLVIVLIFIYFCFDRLIFQPPKASYKDNDQIIKLKIANGDVISAIYLPNKEARYVLLVSHGNAEDLGYIYSWLRDLQRHGFAVFAYDYRGYGTSTGKPSEQHTYEDIEAAYSYLTKALQKNPQHIIAYGRSLGAAAAIDLAVHQPLAGLIIESPFVTAFRVITVIPILPFDKFHNLKKIKQIHVPILIIHGMQDQVINIWHGKKIFDATSAPKQHLWVAKANHNNLLTVAGEQYWQALDAFVASLKKMQNSEDTVGLVSSNLS